MEKIPGRILIYNRHQNLWHKAQNAHGYILVKLGWAEIPSFSFDFYLNLEEFYPLIEAKLRSVTPDVLKDPSDMSPTQWWKVLLLNAFNFSRNFFQLNEIALLGLNFVELAKVALYC